VVGATNPSGDVEPERCGNQTTRGKQANGVNDCPTNQVIPAVAYVDSVWLFVRYLPRGFRSAIEAHGCNLRVKGCRDRKGNRVGYWVTVHQPAMGAVATLDSLAMQHGTSLFRFDMAVDLLTLNATCADLLKDWFVTHLLLRWRRHGPMHDEDHGGVYWVKQSHRKRRSQRDMLAYTTFPSKLTGQPCMHLELRFQTAQACRSQGVHRARDLAQLNPAQVFERCVRISYVGETYVQHAIRDAVEDDIRHHKGRLTSVLADRLRAQTRYFVASALKRAGYDRAQWIKDNYPKRIRTTVSPSILAIPERLTWPSATNAPISNHNIHTPLSRKPSAVKDPASRFRPFRRPAVQPSTTKLDPFDNAS
jgi:hypothetical protein